MSHPLSIFQKRLLLKVFPNAHLPPPTFYGSLLKKKKGVFFFYFERKRQLGESKRAKEREKERDKACRSKQWEGQRKRKKQAPH